MITDMQTRITRCSMLRSDLDPIFIETQELSTSPMGKILVKTHSQGTLAWHHCPSTGSVSPPLCRLSCSDDGEASCCQGGECYTVPCAAVAENAVFFLSMPLASVSHICFMCPSRYVWLDAASTLSPYPL